MDRLFRNQIQEQTPPPEYKSQPLPSGSIQTAEFLGFLMYKIWHSKGNVLETEIHLDQNNNVCIPGTEAWFADFVYKARRILKISRIPFPVIFTAFLYIAQLRRIIPQHIGQGSEVRLLIASLMISHKQNIDHTYKNLAWANMTGVPLQDINMIELDFLKGLNWQTNVASAKYKQWIAIIDKLHKEYTYWRANSEIINL
ncbi:hypothetical protein HK103_000598 [Boothiomyces macroporosus]|uniref:Cyclin N-terminal domain-containing protein n=1 Tax=Boothiomyces macroporosus TaxID=261099 RepID=A0AAD5UPQ5_9FUNG|nr:hypothetical protein HK103_000598 [Boothiomyces macroporosus]